MTTTTTVRRLTRVQSSVLGAAFVPMLATGVAGGIGTFSNISHTYGEGTALGAVAAGEGATAVLALVLLGLTLLGQSSPWPVRAGLWALPAAASAMAATAGRDVGQTVIYAVTPMGMCVAAEGMAFLARRIVVHQSGHDAEADRRAAAVVQALAYHRARATNHPKAKVRARSEHASWRLARRAGHGDTTLGSRLLEVQRNRLTAGADAALAAMLTVPVTPETGPVTPDVTPGSEPLPIKPPAATAPEPGDGEDVQEAEQCAHTPEPAEPHSETPAPDGSADEVAGNLDEPAAGLAELAAVTGVPVPCPGQSLTDEQLVVVLRFLRHREEPPLSYRQAAAAFRVARFVGSEKRVRTAWGSLLAQETPV